MGTDIHGWVEVHNRPNSTLQSLPPWSAVVEISELVERSYDVFSSLFGVKPFAQFFPIAASRGIPTYVSRFASANHHIAKRFCGDAIGLESWIDWTEIKAIDQAETALDTRPHSFIRSADGSLVSDGKAQAQPEDVIEVGRTWEVKGVIYRVETISRRDAMEGCPGWKLLFEMMALLATQYSDENVRLVVWFDW